jgi:hypothetical protein
MCSMRSGTRPTAKRWAQIPILRPCKPIVSAMVGNTCILMLLIDSLRFAVILFSLVFDLNHAKAVTIIDAFRVSCRANGHGYGYGLRLILLYLYIFCICLNRCRTEAQSSHLDIITTLLCLEASRPWISKIYCLRRKCDAS